MSTTAPVTVTMQFFFNVEQQLFGYDSGGADDLAVPRRTSRGAELLQWIYSSDDFCADKTHVVRCERKSPDRKHSYRTVEYQHSAKPVLLLQCVHWKHTFIHRRNGAHHARSEKQCPVRNATRQYVWIDVDPVRHNSTVYKYRY